MQVSHQPHVSTDRCTNIKASFSAAPSYIFSRAAVRVGPADSAQVLSNFDCQLKDVIIRQVSSCISPSSRNHALVIKVEAASSAPFPPERQKEREKERESWFQCCCYTKLIFLKSLAVTSLLVMPGKKVKRGHSLSFLRCTIVLHLIWGKEFSSRDWSIWIVVGRNRLKINSAGKTNNKLPAVWLSLRSFLIGF